MLPLILSSNAKLQCAVISEALPESDSNTILVNSLKGSTNFRPQ